MAKHRLSARRESKPSVIFSINTLLACIIESSIYHIKPRVSKDHLKIRYHIRYIAFHIKQGDIVTLLNMHRALALHKGICHCAPTHISMAAYTGSTGALEVP
jgi:hypothetical protein